MLNVQPILNERAKGDYSGEKLYETMWGRNLEGTSSEPTPDAGECVYRSLL